MIKTNEEQMKVKTVKIDSRRYSILKERGYTKDSINRNGEYEELKNRLLNIGGEAVVFFDEDIDKDKIITRGESFIHPQIKIMRGAISHCHSNSSEIWSKKQKSRNLYTGYALSIDGIWRQHSWVMEGLILIETTIAREAYYGFRMERYEAEFFCMSNSAVRYPT